jgi:hypothetical protein
MNLLNYWYRALAVCLSATLWTGCGAHEASAPTMLVPAARSAGHSWMAANASSGDLLYVTGACGGICVFTYPGGMLVGQLSDSNSPQGQCVDKAGDVFVMDYVEANPAILEYAHGGTSPIATLNDPGYYPGACAIDPTTGNLAVTNSGPIAIYAGAKGDPTYWTDSKVSLNGYCAYDDNGNLFVEGVYVGSGGYALVEMPKGSHAFKSIKLNIAPGFPNNMQWAGKYLAIGDGATVIYHVAISGTKGTVIGSTVLNGPSAGWQFWIQGATIIEPLSTSDRPDQVGFWRYPTGGKLRKKISGTEFSNAYLYGTVVSPATSRSRQGLRRKS